MNQKEPQDRIVYSRIKAEFFAKNSDVIVTPWFSYIRDHLTKQVLERILVPYNKDELGDLE